MIAETFGGLCDRCASLQALGLDSQATSDQIENTYMTLVKVWHPDRFAHDQRLRKDAEEKLKEINAAHDYLLSHPKQEQPRTAERQPIPEHPFVPSDFDFEGEETEEIRRILRRRQKSKVPAVLLKVGLGLGAIAGIAIIWLAGDSFLSSNQFTARAWDQLKLEVQHDVAVHFGSVQAHNHRNPLRRLNRLPPPCRHNRSLRLSPHRKRQFPFGPRPTIRWERNLTSRQVSHRRK